MRNREVADPFLVFPMIIMNDDICFWDLFDGKNYMGKIYGQKMSSILSTMWNNDKIILRIMRKILFLVVIL